MKKEFFMAKDGVVASTWVAIADCENC